MFAGELQHTYLRTSANSLHEYLARQPGILAHGCAKGIQSKLLEETLTHALAPVVGNGMRYLMAHNDSNAAFIFTDWQDGRIEGHFAAWHTPCIDSLVVLDYVKLPIESSQLIGCTLSGHILLNCPLNAASHASNHGHLLCIGRQRAFGDDLTILRCRHRVDLLAGHQAQLLSAGNRNRGTTTR